MGPVLDFPELALDDVDQVGLVGGGKWAMDRLSSDQMAGVQEIS